MINWAVKIAGYYWDEKKTSLKSTIEAERCHSDLLKGLEV